MKMDGHSLNFTYRARIACLVGLLAIASPAQAGWLSWSLVTAPVQAFGRLVMYNKWTRIAAGIAAGVLIGRKISSLVQRYRQVQERRIIAHERQLRNIVWDEYRISLPRVAEVSRDNFRIYVIELSRGINNSQAILDLNEDTWREIIQRSFAAYYTEEQEIVDPAVAAQRVAALAHRREILLQGRQQAVAGECFICMETENESQLAATALHLRWVHNHEELICIDCEARLDLDKQVCPLCRAPYPEWILG